jgi:hypothetical protein
MEEERKAPIRLSCHSGDDSKTGSALKIIELIVDATTTHPAIEITYESSIHRRDLLLELVWVKFSISSLSIENSFIQ